MTRQKAIEAKCRDCAYDELDEGTWALPKTSKEKKLLKDLMKKPIPLGKDGDPASRAIVSLIGDDSLLDDLYTFGKKNPKADARPIIRKAMKRLGIKEEVSEAFSKKQARGKDIAKKMMKSKTMKAFAKKVAKMSKVTASDLDKILPDYVSGGDIGALFGEEVKESYSRSLVNKAIKLVKSPKYFQGNMTGAIKAIEKLKKGLSDDSRVRAALQTANEHHKKNGMHTHEEGVAVIDKKTGKTLAYYDSPKMAKNFEPNQKYVKMSDKEFMDKHHPRKGGFFGRTGRIPNAKKKAMKKPLWNEGVDGDAMIDLMQKYLNTKNKKEKKTLLKQINRYQKKLGLKVTEELGKGATQQDYIDDFLKSDSPQFVGKSKDKVIQMAVAAFKAN